MAAAEAPLIAVVGPTAAGKSALGLRLARLFGGEIVSCDSLQVYRGLDVGSAKASRAERAEVPHHLLDVVEPDQAFSAADYALHARAAIRDIAARARLPIVVGGTGLYLRALVDGLFEGPSRQPGLRRRLEALAGRFGDARLHRLLRRLDPEAGARVPPADRVRVVRALEVYFATGRAISDHRRRGGEALSGFRLLTLGLRVDRAALRRAVERRTDAMLSGGLVEEVAGLLARGSAPELRPLQAIGYRQAVAMIEGRLGRAAAREEIVRETMRYAKRQMTWFRHQSSPLWCDSAAAAVAAARSFLECGGPFRESRAGVGPETVGS
jgi:tRNA dimethylallyltransferase